MRRITFLSGPVAVLAIVCCAALPAIAAGGAGAPQDKETFRATAQAIGTGASGQTTVIISISRWSTEITLILLDVDADGMGEGVMAVGAELVIDPDSNTLAVKNVSSQPIRLVNVRK